jgi:putative transposase
VELNPVRAKIVEDPKDYTWSSYKVYAYGKRNLLVDEHPVYCQLSEDEGERKKKYRDFVRGMLKEKDAMKGEMDRRIVYGREDFVKDMAKAYNITEKIKQMERQRGWRNNKENRPL